MVKAPSAPTQNTVALRGDYSRANSDYTVEQLYERYSDDDQAVWRTLFTRQLPLIERYAARTGFDVSRMDWYLAFAYFKLAVICQGIAARAAGGAMLGSGFDDAAALVALQVRAGLHVMGAAPALRL